MLQLPLVGLPLNFEHTKLVIVLGGGGGWPKIRGNGNLLTFLNHGIHTIKKGTTILKENLKKQDLTTLYLLELR